MDNTQLIKLVKDNPTLNNTELALQFGGAYATPKYYAVIHGLSKLYMPASHANSTRKYRCENGCGREATLLNETVRKRGTENVKIMNICNVCYEKITGAK